MMNRWALAFLVCTPVIVWIGILTGHAQTMIQFLHKLLA
jgi:hypothetical protein